MSAKTTTRTEVASQNDKKVWSETLAVATAQSATSPNVFVSKPVKLNRPSMRHF
jgi:hypothetical protein